MKVFTAAFFLFFSTLLAASISVNGSFNATNTCPAYVSKNKKTNPDNLSTQPNKSYELIEINRLYHPDWFRVVIPGETTALRWVSASCGLADYQQTGPVVCEQRPGLANSNVIALSWQPGFCETYGYDAGKQECFHLSATSYSASHLVLHGLWPNQNACGEHYGYCGVEPRIKHCDYDPVSLNDAVAANLRQFMPGYAYGSCLERHEWNKHGSCQLLNSNMYFALASLYTAQMSQTAFGIYLHNNVGKQVTLDDLKKMLRLTFGEDADSKVYLGCKNGILVDVYLQLPGELSDNETLVDLVKKAAAYKQHDGCPSLIKISDFRSDQS